MTRENAWELLCQWNKEPFHRRHAVTVEGVMRYFARELGYGEEEDFWGTVGLLHDLDFEAYPEQHCIKEQEILREQGADERLIRAVALMRPSKSVSDLELKSVKKKFKTANFAAGCSREVIERGAEMLGWTLDDLISRTILAMRSCEDVYSQF